MKVKCETCGHDIDQENAYRFITGWVRKRGQGGTNAVAQMVPVQPARWKCMFCVDREKQGLAPTQGSLM